nr:hypothetical protein [Tanacetum cinerariifolium]
SKPGLLLGDTLGYGLVILRIEESSVRLTMLRVRPDKEIRLYEVPKGAAPNSLGRSGRGS